MKTFVATILLSLLCAARAQDIASLMPHPTRSQSGEFLAYGVPGSDNNPVAHAYFLQTNIDLVQLEPWVLVVSCERIKDVLWREFNFNTPAPGKIFIFLYHAQSTDDPITITPQQFADGWSYRLDMPDMLTHKHYLSALTHVMLLELANRNADGRSAEIPLWLREGVAQQFLTGHEADLIPLIPLWNVNGLTISPPIVLEGRRKDPLAHAHEVLTLNPTLTFTEMSWPSGDDLRGEPGDQFSCSAQLFVARLLNLKNGHQAMHDFVGSLAKYYNWQLALLSAFHNDFTTTSDIEKWWAINVVQFIGHNMAHTWTPEESLHQLASTLRPGVDVRTATNQIPLHTEITLQAIIRDWKDSQRDETLHQVINQLAVLKIRLAPIVAQVAESYQNALLDYFNDRGQYENVPESKRRSSVTEAVVTRAILKKLDTLDAQRNALTPKPKRTAHTNASASLDSKGIDSIVP